MITKEVTFDLSKPFCKKEEKKGLFFFCSLLFHFFFVFNFFGTFLVIFLFPILTFINNHNKVLLDLNDLNPNQSESIHERILFRVDESNDDS